MTGCFSSPSLCIAAHLGSAAVFTFSAGGTVPAKLTLPVIEPVPPAGAAGAAAAVAGAAVAGGASLVSEPPQATRNGREAVRTARGVLLSIASLLLAQ